jgi:hypothetical protein
MHAQNYHLSHTSDPGQQQTRTSTLPHRTTTNKCKLQLITNSEPAYTQAQSLTCHDSGAYSYATQLRSCTPALTPALKQTFLFS